MAERSFYKKYINQSCAKIFRENVKKVKGFVDLLSKVFNFATHRHFLHQQPFIF
jgi:hypothetical protein